VVWAGKRVSPAQSKKKKTKAATVVWAGFRLTSVGKKRRQQSGKAVIILKKKKKRGVSRPPFGGGGAGGCTVRYHRMREQKNDEAATKKFVKFSLRTVCKGDAGSTS